MNTTGFKLNYYLYTDLQPAVANNELIGHEFGPLFLAGFKDRNKWTVPDAV